MRLWALDTQGAVLAERRSDRGMGVLESGQYEGVLLRTLDGMMPEAGVLPVVICGMAGARQGWQAAAYLPVPCPPAGDGAVAVATEDPRLDVRILPGLSQTDPADVMRGEETQIAGLLSAEPGFDGVICLPGTHCKWVRAAGGQVHSFRTAMTGEVFSLLAHHSVLRHSIGMGWDDDAFTNSAAWGCANPEAMPLALFPLRAEALLTGLSGGAARARLSGLLIGAEVAAMRETWDGRAVTLIGDDTLSRLYASTLSGQGAQVRMVPAEEMTLRGLRAARDRMEPVS